MGSAAGPRDLQWEKVEVKPAEYGGGKPSDPVLDIRERIATYNPCYYIDTRYINYPLKRVI